MKFVIELDEKYYNDICNSETASNYSVLYALNGIRNGIPLEDIKAEIEAEIEDCIPACGHDAWWNGKKYGFEEALAILDKHIKENKQ